MSIKGKAVDLQMVVCMAICCLLYSAALYAITPDKESAWLFVELTMYAFFAVLLVMLYADYKSYIKQLWSQDHDYDRAGNEKPGVNNSNRSNKTGR